MLDNIDSVAGPERMNSIEVPLMNLLNEQYLKDVSNSTKVSLNIKRKEGKFIGAAAPYGYLKSKEDKHKLIIDEEVKPIVENIFKLYIDYHSQSEIARILNDSNVLTPGSYKRIKKGQGTSPNSKWTTTTIKKILTQPIYTGDMVQGRTKSYSHKVSKRIPLPKEEWVIVENTHEPIIDKDVFDKVQTMITKNVKPTCETKPSLFAGLLICSDCGRKMQRSVISSDTKRYSNFVCSTYKKFGKSVCSSHLISEDNISDILLITLNTIIKTMIDVDVALTARNSKLKEKDTGKINAEISILNKRQLKLKELKTEAYTDLKLDIITSEEYNNIISSYNNQISAIGNTINKKNQQIESIKCNRHLNKNAFIHFDKYKGITELTRSMVCDLVDSITVDVERNIIISFKFADEVKEYFEHSLY